MKHCSDNHNTGQKTGIPAEDKLYVLSSPHNYIRMTPHPVDRIIIFNHQTGIIGAQLSSLCQSAGQQQADAIDGYSAGEGHTYFLSSSAPYSSFTNASVMA